MCIAPGLETAFTGKVLNALPSTESDSSRMHAMNCMVKVFNNAQVLEAILLKAFIHRGMNRSA
jgi:hypothetical protein